MKNRQQARDARDARVAARRAFANHKVVETHDVVALLEAVIRPGERVCLEGDNQKWVACGLSAGFRLTAPKW